MGWFSNQRFLGAVDEANAHNCLVLPPMKPETVYRFERVARCHGISVFAVVAELALLALDKSLDSDKEFTLDLDDPRSRLARSLTAELDPRAMQKLLTQRIAVKPPIEEFQRF